MSDTIAAIATPQLPGAIGILRLSGPGTLAALDRVFRARNGRPAGAQQPRSMVYGDLLDRCCASGSQGLTATPVRTARRYTATARRWC